MGQSLYMTADAVLERENSFRHGNSFEAGWRGATKARLLLLPNRSNKSEKLVCKNITIS